MAAKYDRRSLKRSYKRPKQFSNQHRSSYIADPKDLKILEGIMCGMTMTAAAIAAGHSRSYAKRCAGMLYARAKALVPINMVNLEDLGNRATERIYGIVDKPETPTRELIPACRLALELCGRLGAPALHLHEHRLPPGIEAMLLSKMKEIQPKRITDGTVVSENPASEG